MHRRLIPWVFAIAAVFLLLFWIMRLPGNGPDTTLLPAGAGNEAKQEKSMSVPWEREGNDLGMVLLDIPTRQAALAFHVPAPGVYVLAVLKSSPAGLAGVHPGDHIAGLNGKAVNSAEELTAALGMLGDGETFEISVRRGQERLTLTLVMEAALQQL